MAENKVARQGTGARQIPRQPARTLKHERPWEMLTCNELQGRLLQGGPFGQAVTDRFTICHTAPDVRNANPYKLPFG